MVTEFSEPGGYFRSENFVSNEMGLQYVIARLKDAVPPGGVYLGVGPEQNFTYLAALNPRIAFIVDIRRQNLLQHLWYKAVFELSPTRGAFLSRLFARSLPSQTSANLSADSLIVLLDAVPADPVLFRTTFADVRRLLVTTHGFALDSTDLATLRYVDSANKLSNHARSSPALSSPERSASTLITSAEPLRLALPIKNRSAIPLREPMNTLGWKIELPVKARTFPPASRIARIAFGSVMPNWSVQITRRLWIWGTDRADLSKPHPLS